MARGTALALMTAAAGCASEAPLHSTLDDQGLTWVTADLMVTLARPAPRFSTAARDYVYLAPVETNNMGTRSHYLWLGLGTTIDRAWRFVAPSTAVTLVLIMDGQPLALPLSSWDALSAAPPYDTPAPVYQVRRARITLDQLERFANAESIGVELLADDGTALSYELWDGAWPDWQAFVTGVEP